MRKMEFRNKLVNLEDLSGSITTLLRHEGYNKVTEDVKSNPKDKDHKLFKIEAYKNGTFGNSATKRPPIKFQIRGKSNHFIVAQQWPEDYSDTVDTVILGIPGMGLSVGRIFRRRQLEKKYWKILNQQINQLDKS